MELLQISYLSLADHKNGKRLWLQGLRLEDAGYDIGTLYVLNYDDEQHKIVLSLSTEGTNRVSRKKAGDHFYPLIDIVNQQVKAIFETVERVRVTIENGRITIEHHDYDQLRIDRENRLRMTLEQGRPITTASAAHGAGIMDYYIHQGLADEGYRSSLIWAIEPVNDYLQCSLRNNPIWAYESMAIEGRLEDVDASDLTSPLIWAAGLPCVAHSRSGKSKKGLKNAETDESAGNPYISWLALIKRLSPVIIIFENVPEYQNSLSMHMIREALSDWQYVVHEVIVDRELGAFEDRKRLAMVAVSAGIDFSFDLRPTRQREQFLGEILEDIPDDSDRWKTLEYLDAKEARDKAAGKGFRMQLVDKHSTAVLTVGRHYAKFRSTEALVVNERDASLKRLLTVREHCRVKGIDASLVAGLSATKAHQCLGQSVLGPAFQAIGRNIAQCLKKQFPSKVIEQAA